jgi:hypothetical protein
MVSLSHEAMHRYFRDNPENIDQLFRQIGFRSFPDIAGTEDLSGDVTMIDPTLRQADSVLRVRTKGEGEFVLIFEAQRRPAEEKRTRWPQYITSLYDRHEVPVLLVVICHDEATAEWASQAIVVETDFWRSCMVNPLVIGPHNVPLPKGRIREADLAFVVLSVITHGKDPRVAGILEPLAATLHKADEATRNMFSQAVELALVEPSAAEIWRNLMFIKVDEETLRESAMYGELVEGLEAKAEAKGEATSVLAILEERQVEVADVQRERILAVYDREMLHRWLRAAMHVASADELFD